MAEQGEIIEGAERTDALEGAEDAKGKGASFLLILLPLMLLSSGAGAWLAYAQYPALAEMTASGPEEATDEPIEFGEFMELSNIIVNPADSDGRRLLMLSLGMETSDAAILESLTQREMVVRDTIIKILGQRTVDQLANIEERTLIKDQLRDAVNGIISEGEINRMYFTQYVLQ